ncbi:hypothetical protein BC826DRAFT_1111442 [Russula brevipes]|nr:hypothetical protein BC826DRAFT_1111442 [Russula brevipes]
MSTHRHCATFNLVSSKISPDLDLDPIPTGAGAVHAPECESRYSNTGSSIWLSLPAHPYRKMDLSFRVLRSPQAATFMCKIQRTLALVQSKDGIIPNMSHLALPQLLQLPGMPGVPWGAFPAVFPFYVPWTMSARTTKVPDTNAHLHNPASPKGKMRSLLTPQEWRTFLEKSWATCVSCVAPPPRRRRCDLRYLRVVRRPRHHDHLAATCASCVARAATTTSP